jgi:hypothetical protein
MEEPMPKPWFGIEHGKQWPYWVGVLVFGALIALVWSLAIGGIILWGTNIAGAFVMGRRIARRKGYSPDLAALFVLIGGWITVFVYQCLTPKEYAKPEPVFSER